MASQTQVPSESSAPAASEVLVQRNAKKLKFIFPSTFTDKEEERKYKLGKLAAAFRIFAEVSFSLSLILYYAVARTDLLRSPFLPVRRESLVI